MVQLELIVPENATGLRQSMARYHELQAQRATHLAAGWTEGSEAVREVDRQIAELMSDRIPGQTRVLLDQLGETERQIDQRLAGAASELRSIPQRATREAQLQREADLAAGIYQQLATRTAAAVSLWEPHLDGAVVAIGNAPTALFHLLELILDGGPRPAAIVGCPVGFIGAAESKQALIDFHEDHGIDIPFVTVRGRRGGSAMTSSALNALAQEIE